MQQRRGAGVIAARVVVVARRAVAALVVNEVGLG
jgi:hypothetical protein